MTAVDRSRYAWTKLVASAFDRFAKPLVITQADTHQIHYCLLHGDFDLLSLTRSVALHECGEDTNNTVHPSP